MNRTVKSLLLTVILVAGASCVQAGDHGPSDGVEITRTIVNGISWILRPYPSPPPPPRWCPPPPPPRWCPPPPRWNPPPRPPHHMRPGRPGGPDRRPPAARPPKR